jgi:hypothetical protein
LTRAVSRLKVRTWEGFWIEAQHRRDAECIRNALDGHDADLDYDGPVVLVPNSGDGHVCPRIPMDAERGDGSRRLPPPVTDHCGRTKMRERWPLAILESAEALLARRGAELPAAD